MPNLRDRLTSLMRNITSNEIIIKPADKRSIVVVMMPEYFWWTMSQPHLNNEQYYQYLFENDPLLIINEKLLITQINTGTF